MNVLYNDRFSGFRFFSLNVGEAMLSDCGRPFHSTLPLPSRTPGLKPDSDVTRKAKRQNLTFVYIFRKYQIRCFNHSYGKL
jgi:hypothetical protein